MKSVLSRSFAVLPPKRLAAALIPAALGLYLLAGSSAATFSDGIEAERGVAVPGASVVAATGASGGQAVRFAAAGAADPHSLKCAQLSGLQFCDDFDGPTGTAPDRSKWRILDWSSWGGQCFRDARENIALDGQGNLRQTLIDKGTTQCTDGEGYPTTVTSGGMDTQGKAAFRFGRFEIRAKLSCAKSVWGAIWLSGTNGPPWPESGEIDFYELFENKQNVLKHTIHAGNPYWNHGRSYTYDKPLCQDYHVYGGEWREGYIQFMLDGRPTHRFDKATVAVGKTWPFDTYQERLIIDLQYGSPGWPAAGEWDKSELPSSMLVDYVRIYE